MLRGLFLLLICTFWGQSALANAPQHSLRPKARPVGITSYVPHNVVVPVYYNAKIRPKPRPAIVPVMLAPDLTPAPLQKTTRPNTLVVAVNGTGPVRSLRPKHRPKNMRRIISRARKAARKYAKSSPDVSGPKRGSVCGDRAIRGQAIARIRGRISGCGIANPVKITAVDGVALSTPATIDCNTAKALKTWVRNGAKPAVGRMGGGIKSLRVVAHYACRNRNNKRGGKLSEHARGKAIDIAAINLKDGTSITLLKGWRHKRYGPVLKRMHKSACGPFGTVLGPNANRYHLDHFHFDTASYRSGPYCR
ncbi:MAG TPA: extensin-like protein [Rhodobacteraceae bacterium]|nr:extensin-like protein [Paracoccaceae bacterium]